jgi:hypothetical protein
MGEIVRTGKDARIVGQSLVQANLALIQTGIIKAHGCTMLCIYDGSMRMVVVRHGLSVNLPSRGHS